MSGGLRSLRCTCLPHLTAELARGTRLTASEVSEARSFPGSPNSTSQRGRQTSVPAGASQSSARVRLEGQNHRGMAEHRPGVCKCVGPGGQKTWGLAGPRPAPPPQKNELTTLSQPTSGTLVPTTETGSSPIPLSKRHSLTLSRSSQVGLDGVCPRCLVDAFAMRVLGAVPPQLLSLFDLTTRAVGTRRNCCYAAVL